MKVITSNPVITTNGLNLDYSNLDGKSKQDEILAFQKFANLRGAQLKEDGIFGEKTSTAYMVFGPAFESSKSTPNSVPIITSTTESGSATSPAVNANDIIAQAIKQSGNANLSIKSPTGETKKGMVWDKTKNSFVKLKDSGIFGKALDILNSVRGAKGANAPVDPSAVFGSENVPSTTTPVREKSKFPTKLVIGIGAGILAVVVLYVVYTHYEKNVAVN